MFAVGRHRELNLDTVTHLSTNWAQCRLTLLIETNALPLCLASTALSVPMVLSQPFIMLLPLLQGCVDIFLLLLQICTVTVQLCIANCGVDKIQWHYFVTCRCADNCSKLTERIWRWTSSRVFYQMFSWRQTRSKILLLQGSLTLLGIDWLRQYVNNRTISGHP